MQTTKTESRLIIQRIKEQRLLQNFTQEYMAFELGITQGGYCAIESGRTSLSINQLLDIAKVLQAPLIRLLEGKDCIDGAKVDFNKAVERLNQQVEKMIQQNQEILNLLKEK